ncbi:MAG: DNA polymerase/3'-5' exonuclease PolX [Thermoanaerobaculia bacterium]|nr:DNA polymerase/3'-5' exonuclease PolX [Thermoanaerobaculia bacterium]
MDRREVARILEDIAAMLELKGENPFKVRAYENGARAVLGFGGDLDEAVRTGALRSVRGIGAGLFSNIKTLVETGALPYHAELRAAFPPGLRECLRIPGFGARKAKQLHQAIGIDSLAALEKACQDGRVAGVKGFGPRSAEKILKSIAVMRASSGYHLYHRARARAEDAVAALQGLAENLEIAGSLRRRCEVIRDIDLVATAREPAALASAFRELPGVTEVTADGPTKVSVRFHDGLAADLRVVAPEEFPAALLYFTGSKEHNTALRGRARRMGLKLNEYGLYAVDGEGPVPCASEADIYRALGLAYIEPELREGRGEIEAAERGELPVLVQASDLRGLIHVHTTESDGRASLEEMVSVMRQSGYGYVAITDHSQTATYAGGLTPDRVRAQREEIRALRRRLPDFRIFHGTEADILADGSIDYGDDFLPIFDVVVASVHSRFGLSREEQTQRLIRAVRNPFVSVLGHPTGRLLLSREPIAVDAEAVIDAAAESGCAIEMNCNPHRLDLDWRLGRRAIERGVLIAIDPDAHSVREIELVPYGIGIARKGWVTPKATLNALSASELERWLTARRGVPLAEP